MAREVDERWQTAGSGEHYLEGRWRSGRARERDPRMVARLLASLPAGPPIHSILDVPSGTGRLRGALPAPLVVQSDISESMLLNSEASGAATPKVQGSAAALPFADRAFDLVVCCRLLHHLREPAERAAVLEELMRVAARYVIASYWDAASYAAWRRRTTGPLRRRRRPDVREALDFTTLQGEIESAGGCVLKRVHSLRFVSQQSFFLAAKK